MPSLAKILVPVDFSECSKVGLERALELASEVGASVNVVHIIEPARYVQPGLMVTTTDRGNVPVEDFVREQCERDMAEFLAGVDTTSASVEGSIAFDDEVIDGVPYEMITRLAEERGYDLIVCATHGRSGFKHLVMGSVAERILRHATCPVLVVPCGKTE